MSLVKVTQADGRIPVTVFELQDRVNLGNTAELEQAGKEAYASGTRDLVVDISKVDSFTSAGIRALMSLYKLLAGDEGQKSKHVKLVSPTSYVREVLEISGVANSIEIYDTLDEAIASF
ncbi:MAG: STAS domain-containing protein [Anaerolineales bacterium]|jgi:anti-anti-sigma factor